ncbi:hypothetical protein Dimus_014468 [Dionaea muscipula]
MESDLGKLFIGGISWDTDENSLKEYFEQYGEVVESMIMRDRITGRGRGFGFVVFSDPSIAQRVVMDKHVIDGRTVDAKKAVPREDQHNNIVSRNGSIIVQGSGRTKKIFVGGLGSTVTESDFKRYFDQFGTVTDAVVMYDHNTQRPRGFGFITYDSPDAVDRVLHKTFHDLNGKMVEVKRAVPKELSPGPNRSPLVVGGGGIGYNSGSLNLINNGQSYNLSAINGFGRLNTPVSSVTRSGFHDPFATGGYGVGMNMRNFSPLHPRYGANSHRHATPTGYNGGINTRNNIDSLFNNTRARSTIWGSGFLNNRTSLSGVDGDFLVDSFEYNGGGVDWGSSSATSHGHGESNPSGYIIGRNLGYGFRDGNVMLEGGNYRRNSVTNAAAVSASPFVVSARGLETAYTDLYRGSSSYLDSTTRTASSELDDSAGSFGFILSSNAAANSEVGSKTSEGFIGSYSTTATSRHPTRGNPSFFSLLG